MLLLYCIHTTIRKESGRIYKNKWLFTPPFVLAILSECPALMIKGHLFPFRAAIPGALPQSGWCDDNTQSRGYGACKSYVLNVRSLGGWCDLGSFLGSICSSRLFLRSKQNHSMTCLSSYVSQLKLSSFNFLNYLNIVNLFIYFDLSIYSC